MLAFPRPAGNTRGLWLWQASCRPASPGGNRFRQPGAAVGGVCEAPVCIERRPALSLGFSSGGQFGIRPGWGERKGGWVVFSFLNPLALFGLLAAALPLVIHLLSRWRTTTLDFSSLLLLRKVQSRNVRRLRTRQWLLLILRTLIIAMLMLVPARPAVRGLLGGGPRDHLPVEAIFLADGSASTRYVDSRGQVASLLAGKYTSVTGWLGPSDRYRLLRVENGTELTAGDWVVAGNRPDGDGARAIENPGYGHAVLAGALEQAAGLFSADGIYQREIYLLTDRQRGFLGRGGLAVDSSEGIRFYLLDGSGGEPQNIAVRQVGFPGELVRPGAPLEVTVSLERFGGDSTLPVFPRVYLDNRLVGQGEALLEPDGAVAVVVEIPPLEPGYHELAAEIDADALAADNRRVTVLWVPPVSRVTLVQRGLPPGTDYLGAALEVLSSRTAGAVRFRRAAALPVSPSAVAEADVYIVHGLEHPARALTAFLTELRRQGRHALFVPRSDEPVSGAFNSAAGRLDLPLGLGALKKFGGAGFDLPVGGQAAGGSGVFDRLFSSIEALGRVRLFGLRELESPAGGGAVRDLGTRAGRGLLRMVRMGRANLILSSADISSLEETELPGTPLFVPFVHSLVTMLTRSGPLVPQGVSVGEKVTFNFGGSVNTAGMEIHGPGDERYLLPPGERVSWDFTRTDEPGAYWLYRDGELAAGFGVGLHRAESDVRLEPLSLVEQAFGGLEFHHVPGGVELAGAVLLGRGGVEIWPWLLMAALVLLGVEQVVANRRGDE